MRSASLLALAFVGLAFAGCLTDEPPVVDIPPLKEDPFVPHVIVGVPDSGINPYHALYYRENNTAHPCTYIVDFPCDVQALNLSVGVHDDWEKAFEADKALWESVEPETWYWIPKTVFVAVACDKGTTSVCILDDNGMHGTGTTSSILTENPDALIAFKEGGSGVKLFHDAGILVDLFSVSWGYIVPVPIPSAVFSDTYSPIYIKAAGNDPRSSLMDSWSGAPDVISVGGAYAEGTEEALATKQPDIVSYYCRPTAQTKSIDEMRDSYCGTSFAAPTAAGGISKVILALRQASGYNGTIEGGYVDPVLEITVKDLRNALNLTASYSPENQYPNSRATAVPLNKDAPWLQWGWGFYDGLVADTTIAFFLEGAQASKPAEAAEYMATMHDAKKRLYG